MSKETKESKENIEDDYDINLKIDEKLFNINSKCNFKFQKI